MLPRAQPSPASPLSRSVRNPACFVVLSVLISSCNSSFSIDQSLVKMRFSTCLSALAIAAGLVSAAHHSGRSLKHVGKADKPRNHVKRGQPQGQQQTRRDTSQYLTNSSSSKKKSDPKLSLYSCTFRIRRQWNWDSRGRLRRWRKLCWFDANFKEEERDQRTILLVFPYRKHRSLR